MHMGNNHLKTCTIKLLNEHTAKTPFFIANTLCMFGLVSCYVAVRDKAQIPTSYETAMDDDPYFWKNTPKQLLATYNQEW